MSEETAVPDRPIGQPRPLAVVTGASSGIGLELAQCFADGGFDLLLTALEAEVSLVADRLGGEVATRAVQADLSTVEGVETLLAEVRALGRPVDALALNAGTAQGGRFVETPLDGEVETIRLNVESTVRLSKALLPAMVERGSGRVLVTSSTAATQPGPYLQRCPTLAGGTLGPTPEPYLASDAGDRCLCRQPVGPAAGRPAGQAVRAAAAGQGRVVRLSFGPDGRDAAA